MSCYLCTICEAIINSRENKIYSSYNHGALHGSTMNNISISTEIKTSNIMMNLYCKDGGSEMCM